MALESIVNKLVQLLKYTVHFTDLPISSEVGNFIISVFPYLCRNFDDICEQSFCVMLFGM